MSKQTAVEWLEEELAQNLKSIVLNQDYQLMETLFEQAKAIEREQIQSAYKDGLIWRPNDFLGQQQYYDEIYGGDK
jgi:hypothetical protein